MRDNIGYYHNFYNIIYNRRNEHYGSHNNINIRNHYHSSQRPMSTRQLSVQ